MENCQQYEDRIICIQSSVPYFQDWGNAGSMWVWYWWPLMLRHTLAYRRLDEQRDLIEQELMIASQSDLVSYLKKMMKQRVCCYCRSCRLFRIFSYCSITSESAVKLLVRSSVPPVNYEGWKYMQMAMTRHSLNHFAMLNCLSNIVNEINFDDLTDDIISRKLWTKLVALLLQWRQLSPIYYIIFS